MVGRLWIVGRDWGIERAAQAEGPPVTPSAAPATTVASLACERPTLVPFAPTSSRGKRIEQLGELLPAHLRSLPPATFIALEPPSCDTCPRVLPSVQGLRSLEAVLRSRLPPRRGGCSRGERIVAHGLARHHDRWTGRLHRGWWRRTRGRGASENRTFERIDGDRVVFAANVPAGAGVTLPVRRSIRVLS